MIIIIFVTFLSKLNLANWTVYWSNEEKKRLLIQFFNRFIRCTKN